MPAATVPVAPLGAHQLLVFLLQAGLLLTLAFALGRAAMKAGMPALVGELCAGVIAGPTVLAHIAPSWYHWLLPRDPVQLHLLDAAAQIGVLLLVGLTGAYMDLGLLRRRAGAAGGIGVAALLVPLGLGVAGGMLLPGSLVPHGTHRATIALFLGVALGASAIPVIAKILLDMRLLHRNVGQLTLCVATIDDTAGWLLLSVVAAMATVGPNAGRLALSVGYLASVAVVAVLARPVLRIEIRTAYCALTNMEKR